MKMLTLLDEVEVIECYKPESVKKHIGDADAVILSGAGIFLPYWDKLTFLNDYSGFIGKLHADVWGVEKRAIQQLEDIRVDVIFHPYKALMEEFQPKWKKFSDVEAFWMPFAVDVCDLDVPRDIDIIHWGRPYKRGFRCFVRKRMGSCVVQRVSDGKSNPRMYDVDINGQMYKYAFLTPSRSDSQLGLRLYKRLCHCKIAVTGPGCNRYNDFVPVAKFIENAACGVVTITSTFLDREDLGFEHGENIWFSDEERFIDDLTYLLEHDDIVQEISEGAKELVRTRHTRRIRGQQLYKFLCERTGRT